jgi:hypothetical protein
VPQFPHAKTVLATFLDQPVIDFDVVPLGLNVMEVPGLFQVRHTGFSQRRCAHRLGGGCISVTILRPNGYPFSPCPWYPINKNAWGVFSSVLARADGVSGLLYDGS